MFYLVLCNLACWTATEDVHGYGGVAHSLTTVHQCQTACINDVTCLAIDWEPSNAAGKTCWILRMADVRPTTKTAVITHYQLQRNCLG